MEDDVGDVAVADAVLELVSGCFAVWPDREVEACVLAWSEADGVVSSVACQMSLAATLPGSVRHWSKFFFDSEPCMWNVLIHAAI